MLKRIIDYLQHAAYTLTCASQYGCSAAILYGVSPWIKRELRINIGPKSTLQIRGRTNDIAVFRDVFLRGSYNIDIREPMTILDAGANIGSASVYFARRFPNARIVAVEPESSNYRMLLRNTAPYKNIMAINGAVWSYKTRLNLVDPNKGEVSFRVQPSVGDQAKIQAYSISDLAEIAGISHFELLKVDIEGAEGEVFRVGGEWLQKASSIFVELHDRYHVGASKAVLSRLLERNFRLATPPGSIFVEFN